jgi:hypothetical protein
MIPSHSDLCVSILALGGEPIREEVAPKTFQRLAELGLAHWIDGDWALTAAGDELLPSLWAGEAINLSSPRLGRR